MTDKQHAVVLRQQPADVPQRVHPVVAQAMQSNPDPSTLRELLAVQREWEAGEARRSFARALVALKADLPAAIDKDATVDFTNKAGIRTHYKHTSLANALESIVDPLRAHGFVLTWIPSTPSPNTVTVLCRLLHCDGHFDEATLSAPVDTSGNKSPAQGVASTVSLLSRYTALALLGIGTKGLAETTGGSDPDAIDTARTVKALAAIARKGLSNDDAERFVGVPFADWTNADLDKLKVWLAGEEVKP
jgi:hypothetical protein